MLSLYEHPLSAYAMKVKMALLEKKLEFKPMIPDGMANGTAIGPLREVRRLLSADEPVQAAIVVMEGDAPPDVAKAVLTSPG